MAASTSVHMVEWAPPYGCLQCLCPQGELQLPPVCPGGPPRSAGGSDSGSFQITASALDPRACEILCVPFKSGVSYFPQPFGSPKRKPHWPSKPNHSGVSSSQWRTPGLGRLMWVSDPLFLGENVCNCNYSPVRGSSSQGMGLGSRVPGLCPYYLSRCGSFFISLVVEGLLWQIQVFLINSCSVNSCHFRVLMRESELRVFLLFHLSQVPIFRDSVHLYLK